MRQVVLILSILCFCQFLKAQNDSTPDSWNSVDGEVSTSEPVFVKNNLTISNGKLGIYTATPAAALHVSGAMIISGVNNGTADSDWGTLAGKSVRTMFSNRYNGIENGVHGFGIVSANHFESPFIYGYQLPGNKIVFGSILWGDRNPATGLTPRMVINTDNGNVGIGTTEPEEELDVCGNIRAEEIIVEEDWCDYVFDKNYHLPTLEEQKVFIEENGHLKNFESESEMNGQIQVGDVSKRQQQTLEEVMLYLIDLKAEMVDLKKENEVLKKEVEALKK